MKWTDEDILKVVIALTTESGYPPSVREIMDRAGAHSLSTIQHHLDRLVGQGRLLRQPGQARTLRPPYPAVMSSSGKKT
jgi:repressor LexA